MNRIIIYWCNPDEIVRLRGTAWNFIKEITTKEHERFEIEKHMWITFENGFTLSIINDSTLFEIGVFTEGRMYKGFFGDDNVIRRLPFQEVLVWAEIIGKTKRGKI